MELSTGIPETPGQIGQRKATSIRWSTWVTKVAVSKPWPAVWQNYPSRLRAVVVQTFCSMMQPHVSLPIFLKTDARQLLPLPVTPAASMLPISEQKRLHGRWQVVLGGPQNIQFQNILGTSFWADQQQNAGTAAHNRKSPHSVQAGNLGAPDPGCGTWFEGYWIKGPPPFKLSYLTKRKKNTQTWRTGNISKKFLKMKRGSKQKQTIIALSSKQNLSQHVWRPSVIGYGTKLTRSNTNLWGQSEVYKTITNQKN